MVWKSETYNKSKSSYRYHGGQRAESVCIWNMCWLFPQHQDGIHEGLRQAFVLLNHTTFHDTSTSQQWNKTGAALHLPLCLRLLGFSSEGPEKLGEWTAKKPQRTLEACQQMVRALNLTVETHRGLMSHPALTEQADVTDEEPLSCDSVGRSVSQHKPQPTGRWSRIPPRLAGLSVSMTIFLASSKNLFMTSKACWEAGAQASSARQVVIQSVTSASLTFMIARH